MPPSHRDALKLQPTMAPLLLFLSLLLCCCSLPLSAPLILHTLSPQTLLESLLRKLRPPSIPTLQTLYPTTLIITLSPPFPPANVQVTLSTPSHRLHLTLTPPDSPPYTLILKLAATIDATRRVRFEQQGNDLVLGLRLLEASVKEVEQRCKDGLECLRKGVGELCGGREELHIACGRECLRARMRQCQAGWVWGGLLREVWEVFLRVGILGAVLLFVGGGVWVAIEGVLSAVEWVGWEIGKVRGRG